MKMYRERKPGSQERCVDPSAFVREILFREISCRLGCIADDLSIAKDHGGTGAPCVMFRGLLLTREVSLSHDGRFAAFAFDPDALVHAGGR
jgi:hypothetical protein